MSCPDENVIVAFAQGLLDEDSVAAVEAHIDGCRDCAVMVSEAAVAVGDPGPGDLNETSPVSPVARGLDVAARSGPLARGTSLGRYVILDLLGSGGLGHVYTAYDPELDRRVAIKLLRPSVADAENASNAQRWLLREAQAMAKLSHPNVVPVYDVGTVGEDVFVAMELVRGGTLRVWLREREPGWREVRDMLCAAGLGLLAAHDAGLVHRDFKPTNVLISADSRPRVVDFGLARAIAGLVEPGVSVAESNNDVASSRPGLLDSDMTQTGAIVGTPAYMAPEQLEAQTVDARADQFAFCVTLYEALYGERPFRAKSLEELRRVVRDGRIGDPPAGRPVPAWLRRVVLVGLSVDPDARYPSMRELLFALVRDRRSRRRQWAALATVGVLSAVVAGSAAFLLRPEPTPQERETVQAVVEEARAAAARAYFLYPPVDDPDYLTAYARVLELEATPGSASDLARSAASDLRLEFSSTLTRLGDSYWEREGGAPFAADYYAAAVVFDPDNQYANGRMMITPGQLAELTDKAGTLEFTQAELAGAASLVALAEPDEDERRRKLAALTPPVSTSVRLDRLFGTSNPAEPDLRASDPEPAKPVEEEAEPAPSAGTRVAAPGKAPSRSARRDPQAAKSEVAQGRAALKRGNPKQAAQHFHRALQHDAKSSGALGGLSEVHFERGEFTKAVQRGEQAVRLAPKSARFRFILADAYLKVLRYGDARRAYERAKSLGHPRAAARLALLKQKLGE